MKPSLNTNVSMPSSILVLAESAVQPIISTSPGLQLARAEIRNDGHRNRSQFPINAVTSYALAGDESKALAAGYNAYITNFTELSCD
jgi:CheY-like chemotaxis protein